MLRACRYFQILHVNIGVRSPTAVEVVSTWGRVILPLLTAEVRGRHHHRLEATAFPAMFVCVCHPSEHVNRI